MRFDGPPDGPTVTLSFSIWDDCADGLLIGAGFELTCDCYALDIRVELPNCVPTADSPETPISQTSRAICQQGPFPRTPVPARQDICGLLRLFIVKFALCSFILKAADDRNRLLSPLRETFLVTAQQAHEPVIDLKTCRPTAPQSPNSRDTDGIAQNPPLA